MLSVLTVVLVGLMIGWWVGDTTSGWKSYLLAVLLALLIVPAAGVLVANLDVKLFGGSQDQQAGIALGLGLAVALIEVPWLVFKRQLRKARLRNDASQTD